MGAKLFKSFLLYQGENVDKPFLDILNVDEWFELIDIRNEIAHDYGESTNIAISVLNYKILIKLFLFKVKIIELA